MPRNNRYWIIGLVLLGLTVASLAVWWGGRSEDGSEEVLARVGDEEITLSRFTRSYLQFLMGSGSASTIESRRGHLENMIQDRLLAQEARRRGVGQGPEYSALLERHELMAAGARYFEREFADDLPALSERQVRDAYEKSNQKVILRQLFFRDPSQAEAAWNRLQEGQDFVLLANEVFQTAEYDSLAGFLGVATYWDLDDPVAEVAFNMSAGEVSRPVRSSHGWHIIRVEDRLVNPILIEEDFQRRRASMEGRARIRRNRLEGDAWVRSFMEAADVQVNQRGMKTLADAVDQALNQESEEGKPRPRLLVSELTEMQDQLRDDTPLLLYSLDGRDITFTAGDFFRWIPELAYNEVRDTPAAAVGRALRNEILGLKGIEAGLHNDPLAREAVAFASSRFLANRLRDELRTAGTFEPSDEEVQEAYEKLGFGALVEARATYWRIQFGGLPGAEAALASIRSGERRPESFEGYDSFTDEDVLGGSFKGHIRRMQLGEPQVVCLADGSCSVAAVSARTTTRRTVEEARHEITALLRTVLPEERLTDSLRVETSVWINENLFNQMARQR